MDQVVEFGEQEPVVEFTVAELDQVGDGTDFESTGG